MGAHLPPLLVARALLAVPAEGLSHPETLAFCDSELHAERV